MTIRRKTKFGKGTWQVSEPDTYTTGVVILIRDCGDLWSLRRFTKHSRDGGYEQDHGYYHLAGKGIIGAMMDTQRAG